MTIQYHWLFGPVSVINPHTFTEYHSDVTLPAGHTLRRILVNTPSVFFKRGSVTSDDQQMYFVHYDVTYGETSDPIYLYRSVRTLKEVRTVDPTGVTTVYESWHSGAELEIGFNEKVQRGGPGSFEQRLRLAWSIGSSGSSEEELSGEANIGMRSLYSVMV